MQRFGDLPDGGVGIGEHILRRFDAAGDDSTTIEALRDMDQDFGILVYPKSEAEQESYHSLVHDAALIGGIPISSVKVYQRLAEKKMETLVASFEK